MVMGVKNKVAVTIAGLGGALAIGTDAQAQITNLVIPTNQIGYVGGALVGSSLTVPIMGNTNFTISVQNSTHGAAFYLRAGGVVGFYDSLTSKVQSVLSNVALNSFMVQAFESSKLKFFGLGSSIYPTAYYAFVFASGPNTLDYGWIAVNQHAQSTSSDWMSIKSGAYGAHGAAIAVGETGSPIPEPASAALLAIGAMTLGARGVRRMRKAVAAVKRTV